MFKIFNFIQKKYIIKLIFFKVIISLFDLLLIITAQINLENILKKQLNNFFIISVLQVLSLFIYIIFFYKNNILIEKLKKSIVEKISLNFINNFLKSKNYLKSDISSGEIINLIDNDVETIGNYLDEGIFPIIDFIFSVFIGFIYIFYISYKIGIFYILIGVIFFCISKKLYLNSSKYRKEYYEKDDKQKNFYEEIMNNLSILKVYNLKNWVLEKNNNLYNYKIIDYKKMSSTFSKNEVLFNFGIYFVTILSLFIGLILINKEEINIPQLISVWTIGINSILYKCLNIPKIFVYLTKHKVSLERINKNINKFKENKKVLNNNSNNNKIDKIIGNITFKYENSKKYIFKNFHFEIFNNKINYIIGKNGSGKTTLLKILLSQLPINEGNIIQISNGKKMNFNTSFSYVPQNNNLFQTTILNNLTLGKNIKIEKINNLLELVNMKKTIDLYPNKLDEIVNENNNFSLGQIRRLAIVRALLKDCEFILLDEPFSDLDLDNQKILINLFNELKKNIGIIIITHTFDFINKDDNIIKVGDFENV